MVWQANSYSLVSLGAALIVGLVAALAWQRRPALGAGALSLMCVGAAAWGLAFGVYWAAPSPALQVLALDAVTFGAGLAPLGLLLFVLQITGRGRWLTGPVLFVLFGLFAASLLAVLTDGWHHLWFAQLSVAWDHGLRVIDFVPGRLFWVLSDDYTYALALAALGLLAREWWAARGIYRMQYALILAAVVFALGASLASDFGVNPWPQVNLTPIAFAASGPLVAYALFRFRLLDLVPIARSVLMDRMTDAIVVLDRQNRILDINTAALKLVGWHGPALLGQPAGLLFAGWPELLARYRDVYDASVDLQLAPDLTLELLITPLHDQQGQLSGRLVVLRDVTRQRLTERELHNANQQLRTQLTEISHLQDRLREQAVHDALTGLYNRRYLEESLATELARATREGQPVSVVFLDLDHFKQVNDSYGHSAGDRVLQALAHYLVLKARANDLVCRYGGEEIVVILSGAGAEVAAQRAEQWRLGIAQLAVPAGALTIHVTISAGIATYPADGGSLEAVLRAADAALYRAKSDGRNCVRRAQPAAALQPVYHPVPALAGAGGELGDPGQ